MRVGWNEIDAAWRWLKTLVLATLVFFPAVLVAMGFVQSELGNLPELGIWLAIAVSVGVTLVASAAYARPAGRRDWALTVGIVALVFAAARGLWEACLAGWCFPS